MLCVLIAFLLRSYLAQSFQRIQFEFQVKRLIRKVHRALEVNQDII